MKGLASLALIAGAAALPMLISACSSGNSTLGLDGKFVGPPQGSASGNRGLDPLVGATPFTFAPEDRSTTGYAVDHWFMDPGRDSNDGFAGNLPIADAIDALKDAIFTAFVTGNRQQASPAGLEVNVQYAMSVSFCCQWFFRNADNSRPTELDVFLKEVYSDSALDISLITGPVERQYDPMSGTLISILLNRDVYPNRDLGMGAVIFPLNGWTSPPPNEPGGFPPPQDNFRANQFNEIGVVRVTAVTGSSSSLLTTGLGGALTDDTDNPRVENLGAIPQANTAGNAQPISQPTGVFGDNYALTYRQMPVKQPPVADPNATPPIPPQNINDPELEEALIEYSRHFAAVHANLIGQCIGLSVGATGTLMDPGQAVFENRYEYRFGEDDIDKLANQCLPGKFRDPNADPNNP